MSRHQRWIVLFLLSTMLLCLGVGLLNYTVDPLRVFSVDYDKSSEGMRASGPEYISLKIFGNNYDYALVGSSRHLLVDLRFIHKALARNCVNLGMNEGSFYDALIVGREIKRRGKNFVCGLDAFAMNETRFQGKAFTAKQARIKHAIENGNSNLMLFLGSNMFRFTVDTLRMRILGKSYNERIEQIDKMNHPYDEKRIEILFSNEKNVRYSNYKLPADDDLMGIAAMADEKDIFVIYPKYYIWYKYLHINGIDSKYFEAISKIVKNTRAKVFCFYGKYPLTENRSNFDRDGWHFKPSVSRMIYEKVFANKSATGDGEFGFLLTPGNVDQYLGAIWQGMESDFPIDTLRNELAQGH